MSVTQLLSPTVPSLCALSFLLSPLLPSPAGGVGSGDSLCWGGGGEISCQLRRGHSRYKPVPCLPPPPTFPCFLAFPCAPVWRWVGGSGSCNCGLPGVSASVLGHLTASRELGFGCPLPSFAFGFPARSWAGGSLARVGVGSVPLDLGAPLFVSWRRPCQHSAGSV